MKPGDFGLPWEPVSLKTSDQLHLSAWWIPHPRAAGTIILLHGYGAAKGDLLDLANALHRQSPFHLLLLDFRAHGDSEGNQVSFGAGEMLDLEAALDFLAGRPEARSLPIGCFGVSMGGAIALLAADRFPALRAVAVDSVYADLAKAIARTQWLTYHIPRIPFGQLCIWGTELRLARRLDRLSPIRVVGRLAPRPLLVIHGERDAGIPPEEGSALYEQAGHPKEMWLVPGGDHVSSFYLNSDRYTRRVTEFFQDALR